MPSQFRNECFLLALMGGTLTLWPEELFSLQYTSLLVGTRVAGVLVFARCWVLRDRPAFPCFDMGCCYRPLDHCYFGSAVHVSSEASDPGVTGLRVWRRGYRPYFENYTVDASILKMQTKWDGRLWVFGTDRLCHKLSPVVLRLGVTHVISIF